MNRKEFLKKSLQAGLCCCGAVMGLDNMLPKNVGEQTEAGKTLSMDLGERMVEGAKSPGWRKYEQSFNWIKSMLKNMDEMLDEETKNRVLNACGRSCYIHAVGVADENKPTAEAAQRFLDSMEQKGFKIERHEKTTIIYYGWQGEQNPWGLSIKEGFCMCPIVESNVSEISPSYCLCSAGYVKEIFERYTGRQVKKVDVLESIRRGGKDCRFKVELLNS